MQENTVALQALRQAIRLEQDGYKFYTEAAERTADPRGREMFLSLAEDEKLHLRIVRDQHEILSAGQGWISFSEVLEVKPVDLDKPLFPPEREALAEASGPGASEADALLFAMQKENESYELYRKAAIETDDPAGPFGAKGMSEAACIPTAPAIANAVYDAVGVRIRDLPITPEKILKALKGKEAKT